LRGIEGASDLGAIGHIGRDRKRLAARGLDLAGERFEPFLAPRHEDDARAVLREHERESATEAGGSAGDQRHVAGKIEKRGGCHEASADEFARHAMCACARSVKARNWLAV
jgi:hypothetical protein